MCIYLIINTQTPTSIFHLKRVQCRNSTHPNVTTSTQYTSHEICVDWLVGSLQCPYSTRSSGHILTLNHSCVCLTDCLCVQELLLDTWTYYDKSWHYFSLGPGMCQRFTKLRIMNLSNFQPLYLHPPIHLIYTLTL